MFRNSSFRFSTFLTAICITISLLAHPYVHAFGLVPAGAPHKAPVAELYSHVHLDGGDTGGEPESFRIPEPEGFAVRAECEIRQDCPPPVPIAFWQPPE